MPDSPPPIRNRTQLILLGVLFLGPFVAAVLMYFAMPQWRPSGHTNYGQLINPALPLPQLSLSDADNQPYAQSQLLGHWLLLVNVEQRCGEDCAHWLYLSRQVRTRLNRDRSRVQRVFVSSDATVLADARARLGGENPDVIWLLDRDAAGARLSDFMTQPAPARALELFDPLGNWVMNYPPGFEPLGVYNDMHKLLQLSSIG